MIQATACRITQVDKSVVQETCNIQIQSKIDKINKHDLVIDTYNDDTSTSD